MENPHRKYEAFRKILTPMIEIGLEIIANRCTSIQEMLYKMVTLTLLLIGTKMASWIELVRNRVRIDSPSLRGNSPVFQGYFEEA